MPVVVPSGAERLVYDTKMLDWAAVLPVLLQLRFSVVIGDVTLDNSFKDSKFCIARPSMVIIELGITSGQICSIDECPNLVRGNCTRMMCAV